MTQKTIRSDILKGYNLVKNNDIKFLMQDISIGDKFKCIKGENRGRIFTVANICFKNKLISVDSVNAKIQKIHIIMGFDDLYEQFIFHSYHN